MRNANFTIAIIHICNIAAYAKIMALFSNINHSFMLFIHLLLSAELILSDMKIIRISING